MSRDKRSGLSRETKIGFRCETYVTLLVSRMWPVLILQR